MNIPVELISDTMWPNGYIAKSSFTQFLSSYTPPSPFTVSILRVPFLLEPSYPLHSAAVETNRARLLKKWGGPKGWEAQKLRHDLKGRGRRVGIERFNLDRLASNTKMSHRLVREITRRFGYGISEEVYAHISKYHFVDGHALNDLPRLASIVSSALVKAVDDGATYEVTYEWLKEYLEGNEGMREVERTYDMVCDMGINSIPNFVINGEHIIRGAAGEEEFEKVFDEVIKEGKEGEFVFKKSMGI